MAGLESSAVAGAAMNGNGSAPERGPRMDASQIQEARFLAEGFYEAGMEEYNQFLVGEEAAKIMYLSLLAMGAEGGMAGLNLGPPGGGKSLLTKNGLRIVEGLSPEVTAAVPHREDLTPAKLVGDESQMERSGRGEDGEEFYEEFSSKVVPILKPGTQAVLFDEITRTGPLALNASLEITQDGRIVVMEDGKPVEVDDIDLIVSSMNNAGTRFTHYLDPAVVSRHAMGAFMGDRERGQLSPAGANAFDHPYEEFDNYPDVDAVITRDQLHQIRAAINATEIDAAHRDLGKRLTASMLDVLEDHGLILADGRTAKQVLRVARVLSMFRGSQSVGEQDLHEAIGYGATSRLGATTSLSSREIKSIVNKDILLLQEEAEEVKSE